MKVGFFHAAVGPNSTNVYAEAMVASVKRVMPSVPVVQFTFPYDVDKVRGIDELRYVDTAPLALAVLDAYSRVDGDWLLIDTDVLVLADVHSVFNMTFDVAVARRNGTLKDKEVGSKFMAQMPYNKGVVFTRCPLFWQCAYARLATMDRKQQAWMGDQRAMNEVIQKSETLKVLTLDSSYNYPPHSRTEDLSGKSIVHFKGDRKPWMLHHARQLENAHV